MTQMLYGDLVREIQSLKQGKEGISAEHAERLKKHFFSERREGAFELDPDTSTAFRLRFRINKAVVDIKGIEPAALASGHELALSALEIVRGGGRARAEYDLLTPYGIIAEGDSWFQHPFVTTAIDALQHRGYIIRNLAWPGDTMEGIINYKEYMPPLRTGAVTHFLFSGGGNDILGNIETLINRYNASYYDPTNPSHISYYIKSEFTTTLRQLMNYYTELNNDVRSVSVNTLLMVHGYAHARPQEHGIFMGKHFETLGFDMSDPRVKQLTGAIVGELVDQLNRSLRTFAQTHRKVHYFDFRNVLQNDDNDWFNWFELHELHPSATGANKLADGFEAILPATVIAEAAAK
jgi:lysophospholipase L1-like esterase